MFIAQNLLLMNGVQHMGCMLMSDTYTFDYVQ